MPLLDKRSVIAFKVEGTPGTAESLGDADGAFNAYEHEAVPGVAMGLREGQSAFSPLVAIPDKLIGTLSFQTDWYTAPGWESMLGACGMVEATADVWTPTTVTSNWKTATIARYKDGKVYSIKGAMGTLTIQLRPGQVTRCLWVFTGVMHEWGKDSAIITPNYPNTAASAPRWGASTLTWGGIAGPVSAIDIGLNNQVTMLEDASAAAISYPAVAPGVYRAWIAGRAVGGTADPEEALAATRADHNNWLTSTEIALSIAYASTSISIPKLQWTNLPTGNRNGAAVLNATFQANRSADAGDDEISFDLST